MDMRKQMKMVLVAFLLVMGCAAIASGDTLGLWLCDEFTNGLVDSSGNGHTGTKMGTWSAGSGMSTDHPSPTGGTGYDYPSNHSLQFNTDLQWVAISNVASTPAISIQFWYKDYDQASVGDPNFSFVMGKNESWAIERYRADDTSPIRLRLLIKPKDFVGNWWNWNIYESVYVPQDGEWHNVAFTFATNDGETPNAGLTTYLDGVQSRYTNFTTLIDTASTDDTWLGVFAGNSARRHAFEMDELVIYNTSLSGTDILNNVNNSLVPEPVSVSVLAAGSILFFRMRRK